MDLLPSCLVLGIVVANHLISMGYDAMDFVELTADQRRQRIDAKQAFEVWRTAAKEFRHSYRGSMHWRRVGNRDYLSRKFALGGMGANWPQIPRNRKITC